MNQKAIDLIKGQKNPKWRSSKGGLSYASTLRIISALERYSDMLGFHIHVYENRCFQTGISLDVHINVWKARVCRAVSGPKNKPVLLMSTPDPCYVCTDSDSLSAGMIEWYKYLCKEGVL